MVKREISKFTTQLNKLHQSFSQETLTPKQKTIKEEAIQEQNRSGIHLQKLINEIQTQKLVGEIGLDRHAVWFVIPLYLEQFSLYWSQIDHIVTESY